ncbi:efflux RND transporter periplasmic adaptor subunit [Natronospira bacteriovora]|uniref:Efflux RND transporter periplasmic adaptor subunit n=1 Tax=Natronospira bacteriovora TaxID=3069753 RepID=A0ABU0W3J4_9GAMM|nr:efflux RND transporter periplasmic adaptor subunit [Natronospira sp. AB-CW4]MDQ2068534.1 efflux RND transporter periplasmic adaptor subunit [Natronospira sp. AB-CW4]
MNNLQRMENGRYLFPLVLVLAVLLTACAGEDAEEEAAEELSDGTPVQVVAVERATVEELERSVGTVETFTQPVVAAEVSGRVRLIEKDVGDEVSEGDVLARIDREPFEIGRAVAAAEVGRLEARQRQLELDLQRLQRLSEREYATEQDMDAVAAELDATRQQLESARNQLRRAERDLRLTDIVAPVGGLVDERMISEGGFIAAGNPAFRLQPMDRFRAVISFPERVGDRLETGMTVRLLPRGGREGEVRGQITRLRPAVHPGSRSLQVFVEFDNPGNWRPGMTVEARVILDVREEAMRVPAISLVQRPAGRVVYVVEENEVREQVVEIGVRAAEWVEILSGLSGDEKVVSEGAAFLSDGARVRIREED